MVETRLPELEKMHGGKIIQPSEEDTVKAFFNSDEVSRMCPGAKDFVVIRDEQGKKKEKVQKKVDTGNVERDL